MTKKTNPDHDAQSFPSAEKAPTEGRTKTNADVARYISEMSGSLAALAGARKMPMLTYFLNMARVEADIQFHEWNATNATADASENDPASRTKRA